jgi:hypothetical protein
VFFDPADGFVVINDISAIGGCDALFHCADKFGIDLKIVGKDLFDDLLGWATLSYCQLREPRFLLGSQKDIHEVSVGGAAGQVKTKPTPMDNSFLPQPNRTFYAREIYDAASLGRHNLSCRDQTERHLPRSLHQLPPVVRIDFACRI